ncbi:MAG: nitrous oxide reductase accessory protein NosL [Myxococcota bacterium]
MNARAGFVLLLVAACTGASSDGPVDIKWDRDVCRACSMVISDRHFVAEIRGGPKNAVVKFDDLGCALKWLDEQPWANEPATRLWVADQTDGHWLDGKTARYVAGKTSPMGFNFGAVAGGTEGNDFEAQREAVRAFLRRKQQ